MGTKVFMVCLLVLGFCGFLYPQEDRGTEVVAINGYGRLQYTFYQAGSEDEFSGYLMKIIQSAYASFRTTKVSVEYFPNNGNLAVPVINAMRNRRANISSTYADGEFVVNYIRRRGTDTYVISEIILPRPRQDFSDDGVYTQRQADPSLQATPLKQTPQPSKQANR
jgi:hypothetical protein